MYGDDWRYADSRLSGTYVRYRDNLVKVINVESEGALIELGSDTHRVPLNDLDIKPLKLGYVNYRGQASYVVRVPKRRDWRQGTRMSNITSLKGLEKQDISWSAINRTAQGKFPTFRKACSDVQTKEGALSLAFHRRWAVSKNGKLSYMSRDVGKVVDGSPRLDDKYQYLEEFLQECIND